MLPRFRWRWERKDANGGHPLVAKVAERVLEVNLQTLHPEPVASPVLIPEPKWEEYVASPAALSQQPTPTMSASTVQFGPGHSNGNLAYGPQSRPDASASASIAKGDTTPPEKSMANFPTPLFYPFYPEAPLPASHTSGSAGTGTYQEYLAVAATTQDVSYPNHSAHEAYIDDTHHRVQPHHQGMGMWVGVVSLLMVMAEISIDFACAERRVPPDLNKTKLPGFSVQ